MPPTRGLRAPIAINTALWAAAGAVFGPALAVESPTREYREYSELEYHEYSDSAAHTASQGHAGVAHAARHDSAACAAPHDTAPDYDVAQLMVFIARVDAFCTYAFVPISSVS